jgi:glycosyltransferase involved in cell wall biosynthesis/2-polyprenyl-3-methyl-5-hydroxy-6-metoxy-1,4-benzoquinol methylase
VRVLFIHFGTFDCNSAIQVFHFGQRLTEMGFEVSLCAKGDVELVRSVGEPGFECLSYDDLPSKVSELGRDPRETVVHAWTPREGVRLATTSVTRRLGVPYLVHMEDNEEHLVAEMVGLETKEIKRLPLGEQDRIIDNSFAHPTHYRGFLQEAAGVTVITEELNEFNFGHRPHHLARPGVDPKRFAPGLDPTWARREMGVRPEDFVLVYHGIMHHANQREMFSLYTAARLMRRRDYPVRLVRVGESYVRGIDYTSFSALSDGAIEMGGVPWSEIPRYLAAADAFVQPGAPDDFNRYRLPSKVPEFLAMGRPVVLPNCNIGADLSHGENALLLQDGRGVEIADQLERLLNEPALAARLGRAARRFALEQLNWDENATRLAEFYREIVSSARNPGRSMPPPDHSEGPQLARHDGLRGRVARAAGSLRRRRAGTSIHHRPVIASPATAVAANSSASLIPDDELALIRERYQGRFPVPSLSYATVRDYVESRESLGGLFTASFDMMNLQRCWVLKAILGNVEPGSRLIEIGAGEPLVAGILSRMGYEVTVVDPYDGSGNGPREYGAYTRGYPDLRFVRDKFPPREELDGPFGAVYSISVLEHVPAAAVGEAVSAAQGLVAPTGGCCVHAIDHVVRGWGAEEHRERLEQVVVASGLGDALLDETVRRLEDDPDAYFVSAEAHEVWRGSIPYDDYPMRRIASINLFRRA